MGKILLLEDDRDLADAIERLLDLYGHEVRSTASGREAVLLAAREPFALALLDVDVEELSGLGAGRAIADLRIPTVVLSAGPPESWQPAAFRGGAAACLRKPGDVHRLPDIVDALIGTPGQPALDVARLPAGDLERLARLDAAELDALPFGVIELDRDGVVVGYSAYEAAAADRRREDVVGRRFIDIAPCVQVQRFVDAAREAFRKRSLDRVLRFVFPCYGAVSVVAVRLFFDAERQRLWLFISRRALRNDERIGADVAPER